MNLEELKKKASTLPTEPGVYIMRDRSDQVIYVGKAKVLRNRVSQYFQDTAAHSPKTRQMVSNIDRFDFIVAASEFEALILECSLIKRHLPKYNILLKDGKGYPYLRLDMSEQYPTLTLAERKQEDGAEYFGPFGSRGVTNNILKALKSTLRLPHCAKTFPKDIGKGRSCLHYHLDQCEGWCQAEKSQTTYLETIEQVRRLLQGDYRTVAQKIRGEMLLASDNLDFELAASLRDRLNAVEALGRRQLVTAGKKADIDVIGFGNTETKACFAVLHFSDGNLIDKEYEFLSVPEDSKSAVSALVKQFYLDRGFAPKIILLPFEMDDSDLFEQLLEQQFGKKIRIKVPKRGDNLRLIALSNKNAQEEAQRITEKDEQINATLIQLGKMLAINTPHRIESFDISNIAGTDITASMVVFLSGKPRHSEYKKFKINDLENQDDYASMAQVITRRFEHLINKDNGFDNIPDLVLIDGGAVHAQTASAVLMQLGLRLNVFGMVKDDRHRTRALVTPDGKEIRIDTKQSVFALIGNIQEETHRFAITFHRQLRSKRLKYSELDSIKGVGPKRKQELLKIFKSISAIRAANLSELEQYLPKTTAYEVYQHFRNNQKTGKGET